MKSTRLNRRLGMTLMTSCLVLGYSSAALADMATAVVQEEKARDKKKECSIKVQYPTDTTSPLAKIINEYINETLGSSYTGNPFEAKAMVSHYIAECLKPDEDEGEMPEDMPPGEDKTEISKLVETDKFITYEVSGYSYAGGAHGSASYDGMTFRKSDGRRMGWNVFVKTNEANFKNLVKKGLKEYWEIKTDAELAERLLDVELDAIPLPGAAPLFTEEGVKFAYGQYEIAPYAAGMPQFVVPYDKLAPYMTPVARELAGLSAASAQREEVTAEPAAPQKLHLTNARHLQFVKSSAEYRAADERLNAAWKQVRKRLSRDRFQAALAEQRAWVKTGRDAAASRLSGLSPVEAFTRVTEERARELERLSEKGEP